MAVSTLLDAKTIDELKELGKLTGSEMTIVSYDEEQTRKVSIDTIIGYAASILANTSPAFMSLNPNVSVGSSIKIIPDGEKIDVSERSPETFYLEETRQTSIRTKINIPTSIKVSSSLGLRRV